MRWRQRIRNRIRRFWVRKVQPRLPVTRRWLNEGLEEVDENIGRASSLQNRARGNDMRALEGKIAEAMCELRIEISKKITEAIHRGGGAGYDDYLK